MTPHPTLRHFKKGILLTTQWTGTEHKNMEKVFLGVLTGATDPGVIRAVRGVLDFIYYAHFETHCDESLARLDAAWLAFHDNKAVFEDLEIREHFNISKLHNIKHYLDSIRSRGTADGFNTEGSERLHIDLAKMGYRATNKKAYIQQMTTWLRRQEAIHCFCLYLQWAIPGYVAETSRDGVGDDEVLADDGEDLADLDSNQEEKLPYTIAKMPSSPHVTIASITSDFGAIDFLLHLKKFILAQFIVSPTPPTEASTIPIFKQFSLSLPLIPEISSKPVKDTIHAAKLEPGKITKGGLKGATPARMSTVLVQERVANIDKGLLDGAFRLHHDAISLTHHLTK